ncbi:hypothetical protein [Rhodanobacter sp. PCA2]|uniref:hypothetical protein n=1 Tax=Rhodanobacter sp. PCA2 TaxID=2006117 RepID=UPI0015E7A5F3|nr:hypothetical protein [Rhodanobacter sp. PCA2]MBA2078928.1 hypothetical protein [Rhodanobacter sp. PCA2]
MASPVLYNEILQYLKNAPAGQQANAYVTLTAQSPGDTSHPAALVRTVSGSFALDPAGDLVARNLQGVSNQGAHASQETANLAGWTITLKSDGTLGVQTGVGFHPFFLDQPFSSTDGNCTIAPNFCVGTFVVPPGLMLPGYPVPPKQIGVVVLTVTLYSFYPIQ